MIITIKTSMMYHQQVINDESTFGIINVMGDNTDQILLVYHEDAGESTVMKSFSKQVRIFKLNSKLQMLETKF